MSAIVIVSSSAALQLFTTGAPVTMLDAVKTSSCESAGEPILGALSAIAEAVSRVVNRDGF